MIAVKASDYQRIEQYMLDCMEDSAHDQEHIYRVLYVALDIAEKEEHVDCDVLTAACLLHDIGRREQFENPQLCHAAVGAEKARAFLKRNGFASVFAESVASCIRTHRFRTENSPESLEGRILFDADKIDVCGALGIARTICYQGQTGQPLYVLRENGEISDGSGDTSPSFFREYKYKLETLYTQFYTERGKEIALERQNAAATFYKNMLEEITASRRRGMELLSKNLNG